MKKFILTLSLCVALSALAIAAPAIYVVQPVYDFGSVFEGIAITHTYVLKNTGDEVLEISGIRASCGCTTTELATNSIKPGESVDLDILINTTGFSGTISKMITVYSNDPGMPMVSLRVTGQVLKTDPHHISASDARYFLYLLIDLRINDEYNAHHLLGAVNIPVEELTEALADLPRETMIILYDADFEVSEDVALALRSEGFDFTYALVGGLNEWIHQYDMKYITNPDRLYEFPPKVSYEPEEGEGHPSHHLPAIDLDTLFYLCLDVRTADEYATGHIVGAINVPFEELESQVDLLPQGVVLIIYDQAGSLGDAAALWMINNDFENAKSLFGGLDEWILQYGEGHLFTSSLQ